MSLGFVNQVSNHPHATEISLDSVRMFYPDAPIFLSVDGGGDLQYIEQNIGHPNVEWLFNTTKLGYPPYSKLQVLEWFKRLYIGVLKLNTDHFMMIEDDVIILNPIKYDSWVECLGHNITHGNKIPEFIMIEIQRISKQMAVTDYYGNGGGSIFKSSTFIENYHKITKYFNQWWYLYELNFHPPCGYMDCYMTLFYMLCGKPYTTNERMINLDPHTNHGRDIIAHYNISQITELYADEFDIVHGVKHYYGT